MDLDKVFGQSQFISAKELASLLRVSTPTVIKFIQSGMIRAVNVSPSTNQGRYRISRQAVEEFLNSRVNQRTHSGQA